MLNTFEYVNPWVRDACSRINRLRVIGAQCGAYGEEGFWDGDGGTACVLLCSLSEDPLGEPRRDNHVPFLGTPYQRRGNPLKLHAPRNTFEAFEGFACVEISENLEILAVELCSSPYKEMVLAARRATTAAGLQGCIPDSVVRDCREWTIPGAWSFLSNLWERILLDSSMCDFFLELADRAVEGLEGGALPGASNEEVGSELIVIGRTVAAMRKKWLPYAEPQMRAPFESLLFRVEAAAAEATARVLRGTDIDFAERGAWGDATAAFVKSGGKAAVGHLAAASAAADLEMGVPLDIACARLDRLVEEATRALAS